MSGFIKVGGGGVDGLKNLNLLNFYGKIVDNRFIFLLFFFLVNLVIFWIFFGNLFDFCMNIEF